MKVEVWIHSIEVGILEDRGLQKVAVTVPGTRDKRSALAAAGQYALRNSPDLDAGLRYTHHKGMKRSET